MTLPVLDIRPGVLRGHEADFGTSISVSLWKRLVEYQSWIEKSIPIGMLLFFHEEITEADGTPKDTPNLDIWTPCDGSVISDPDSPLDGQTVPDLRDLFLKGGPTQGITGGQLSIDLSHNHGGQLVPRDDRQPDIQADSGTDHLSGSLHTHLLSTAWSSTEPTVPKYTALQAYMRYK